MTALELNGIQQDADHGISPSVEVTKAMLSYIFALQKERAAVLAFVVNCSRSYEELMEGLAVSQGSGG